MPLLKKIYTGMHSYLLRKVSNQTSFYKVHTSSIHHKWALEIKKKIIIVEFHHNTYFVNVDVCRCNNCAYYVSLW